MDETRKCVDCGAEFDPRESLMGDLGQCQLCWEAECDRAWWAEMKKLDEVLGPVPTEAERVADCPIPLSGRADLARFLEAAGVKPGCSSGVEGEITRGYGRLDEYGYFEYPLVGQGDQSRAISSAMLGCVAR